MARPLKRDIRIISEMATDAKRWSVMVKNIDNGNPDGKIRKQLLFGNTMSCYMTPVLALVRFPQIIVNSLPLFHTTFGLAVMGKLALKIPCIRHPVLEEH